MHSDPEIQRLRDEVDKLGRVITEVMGAEFDSIMSKQIEDQRSAMRWMATSMALNVACVQLLLERGLLAREDVIERVAEVRRRLLTHVEAMGSDAEVADWFGDLSGESAAEP
jgi:Mg2+ and Co2+ transporter CorA